MFNFRKKRPNTDSKDIEESGLFSREWYLARYNDVKQSGADPLLHYLEQGAILGYDPGPAFSTRGYLFRYPDVGTSGMNPLLHYIRHGKTEGRKVVAPEKIEKINGTRPYGNFADFLRHCLLQPLIMGPFEEIDRCCFAVMDQLAADLTARVLQIPRNEAPLVSIIMPAYNRETVIADAIDSVLQQSYLAFELIVVDDGSTDSTTLMASRYEADPRVRLEKRPARQGVSAARNLGLALAKGELIAYLDSDNTWLPDYLSTMVGTFMQMPEIEAAFSGQYLYFPGEPEPTMVRFGSFNKSLLSNNNYIDLNCFMHRSSALAKAGGGFCETLKRLEDWDLILRISRSCSMVSVPVLQSNYYDNRTGNSISSTEPLTPALDIVAERMVNFTPATTLSTLNRQVAVVIVNCGALPQLRAAVEGFYSFYANASVELIIVDSGQAESVHDYLAGLREQGVKTAFIDGDRGFSYSANKGAALASSDADILLLHCDLILGQGSIEALQATAYASPDVALTVPQTLLPSGHPDTWMHVPYAQDALPSDITLSLHLGNVGQVGLFHDGERVELIFAPFHCAYIKRDIWNRCGGLDDSHKHSAMIMCEYVRQVLSMKVIYTPAALVRREV